MRQGRIRATRRRHDRRTDRRQPIVKRRQRRNYPQTQAGRIARRRKDPCYGNFRPAQRHRRTGPHPDPGRNREVRTLVPGLRTLRGAHAPRRTTPVVLRQIRCFGPHARNGQNAFGLQRDRNHRIFDRSRIVGLPARRNPGSSRNPRRCQRPARSSVPLQRRRPRTDHAMALQQYGKCLFETDRHRRRRQRLRSMATGDGQSRRDRGRGGPGREIRSRRPGSQHVGQPSGTERCRGSRR